MENLSGLFQYGWPGAILAVIIFQIYMGKQHGNKNVLIEMASMRLVTNKLYTIVSDLHKWHEPDDNGEQAWRNARMVNAVENNTKMITKITVVFERLLPILERLEKR